MAAPEAGLRAVLGAGLSRSMDALISRAIGPLVARARTRGRPFANGRRWVVIHLDGVSRKALLDATRRGYAPFLGRLLERGNYSLTPAYSGAPASTPAFQAGLLYGARDPDIPGFLWFDRAARREVRMDRAEDARAVEAGLAARFEGLMRGGAASFSVFSGGSPVNAFCRTAWAEGEEVTLLERADLWHLAATAVTSSVLAARLVGRAFGEAGSALLDFFRQLARVGRLRHEPTLLLHRMGLSVGAREAATWNAVLDIARGVPALYICFGDYDEIAHRRGPDSRIALLALWGIDRAVARIFAATAAVPQMGYDVLVVSDHGQVRTRPFEEAAGLALADYLAIARPDGDGPPRVNEEAAQAINRYRALDRAAENLPGRALRERAREATLKAARSLAVARGDGEALRRLEDLVAVEAGDIAHVYLGPGKHKLDRAEIEARFGRVLDLLVRSPQVGLVVARDGRGGTAWRAGRRYDLDDPAVAAALDLGYGGARAAGYLRKLSRMESSGDLIAYGNGLAGGRSDVAFAYEFGSHAGVARDEVETFVLHPSHLDGELGGVEHGADLHDWLRSTYVPG